MNAEPPLDPRAYPWREDLAADWLAGRVAAARFAPARDRQVTAGRLPVRARPDAAAPLATEWLFGERVQVYEERDGWAWGQGMSDGYVGYAPAAGLGDPGPAATHEVVALRSFLQPAPALKHPPSDWLTLGVRVDVEGTEGAWARLAGGAGWLYAKHLAPLGTVEPDLVATALRLIGTPYLWGGRTSLGLDCSGLVQLALARSGRACPRDTDQQAAAVGRPVDGPPEAAETGDLLFSPGHAVIAAGKGRVVHANAFWMAVVEEPMADYLARLAAAGQGVTAIRRA